MTYMRDYCAKCGTEIKWYEKMCDRCGNTEVVQIKVGGRVITKEDINLYVEGIFMEADVLLRTGVRCICGRNHYMVIPAIRDPEDYNKRVWLTNLAYCPERVLDYANIANRKEVMQTLTIESGGKDV